MRIRTLAAVLAVAVIGLVPARTEADAPRHQRPFADFDRNRSSDPALWDQRTGDWRLGIGCNDPRLAVCPYSHGNLRGGPGAVAVPGDYDGDGFADMALFEPAGIWWIKGLSDGDARMVAFGRPDDIPVPADYDGNGTTDVAVYRPADGTWHVRVDDAGEEEQVTVFGAPGDRPVPGDYDGDGSADRAVFRPAGGNWIVLGSTEGFSVRQWGLGDDKLVPADYDGDGRTDPAVFRPSTGHWWVLPSDGSGHYVVALGRGDDWLVPADYDGDGRAEIAVYQETTPEGRWVINERGPLNFGLPGEIPVLAAQLA
ncbi:VCBS repeat-containing protein [Actinophytocola sp.]|uniref:FG-GAP repeat domain-containing protein n=1 Tax=Actinophytocola sp. TaxID=1872138 RepID=UPI002D7F6851|nr:VCBS repeat-containing protein [Actinophytocola sp.]HET9137887.1 VCBS repeat-containing protein [Actinophytocola sp.]